MKEQVNGKESDQTAPLISTLILDRCGLQIPCDGALRK